MVGKKPNINTLDKFKAPQSVSERQYRDGRFRDNSWQTLLKQEAAIEGKLGMYEVFK